MSLILKIKKLAPEVQIPKYGHSGDAGLDLCAREALTIAPMERVQVPTGLAMEIPFGYVGLVWDKSGVSYKGGLKTLGGVIDATYRGEIMVSLVNLSTKAFTFEKGHKVAQIIIQKCEAVTIQETEELNDTARGSDAFGSTGK